MQEFDDLKIGNEAIKNTLIQELTHHLMRTCTIPCNMPSRHRSTHELLILEACTCSCFPNLKGHGPIFSSHMQIHAKHLSEQEVTLLLQFGEIERLLNQGGSQWHCVHCIPSKYFRFLFVFVFILIFSH